MKWKLLTTFVAGLLFATSAGADEYSIEVLDEGPPTGELSDEIAAQLASQGVKVVKDGSRTVCEIWFCKSWPVQENFTPSIDVLYPFKPGQLVGVWRFPRRGSDFRDQDISSGVYTLRYALQPIDGSHIGTSPTRDFLLLVSAESDTSAELFDLDKLMTASAEAAESNHPGMLGLQRRTEAEKTPSLRHDEDRDWWIAQLSGTAEAAGKTSDLRLDLVVVGHADE